MNIRRIIRRIQVNQTNLLLLQSQLRVQTLLKFNFMIWFLFYSLQCPASRMFSIQSFSRSLLLLEQLCMILMEMDRDKLLRWVRFQFLVVVASSFQPLLLLLRPPLLLLPLLLSTRSSYVSCCSDILDEVLNDTTDGITEPRILPTDDEVRTPAQQQPAQQQPAQQQQPVQQQPAQHQQPAQQQPVQQQPAIQAETLMRSIQQNTNDLLLQNNHDVRLLHHPSSHL